MDIEHNKSIQPLLKEGEKSAALGKNFNIIMSKVHSFGTDAVLLSEFAHPSAKQKCCDLGTGCGIIPMLWQVKSYNADCVAVELQPTGIDMLNRSIEINLDKMSGKIEPVCADLRQLAGIVPFNCFDVVTCNPPYYKDNSGIKSDDKAKMMTRHEMTCTVYDVVIASKKLLKFGGRLCMCNRPDRLMDTLQIMRQEHIEPKRLRFVQQRADSRPWLFLVEGKKGANPGLNIMSTLIVEDERGGYSKEMREIYGEFGGE